MQSCVVSIGVGRICSGEEDIIDEEKEQGRGENSPLRNTTADGEGFRSSTVNPDGDKTARKKA